MYHLYIILPRCAAEVKSHLLAIEEQGMALCLLVIRTACLNKCLFWKKDILLFLCLVLFLPFHFKKTLRVSASEIFSTQFIVSAKSEKEEKEERGGEERGKEEKKTIEEKRKGDWFPVSMFCFQKDSNRMRRGNGNNKNYKE